MAETRVLIATDLKNEDDMTPCFIDCPDATTGEVASFLISKNTIHECNVYQSRFSSWFINESVQQDGSLHIATPIDPLFLLLPALERAARGGTFCDTEHIQENIDNVSPSAMLALKSFIQTEILRCVCDCKASGGQMYFKLNDAKVVTWLGLKVKATKQALVELCPGFAAMDDSGLTSYAVGIVGEYVQAEWLTKLEERLGIPSIKQRTEAAVGDKNDPSTAPVPNYNPDSRPEYRSEPKKPRLDPKEAAKAKAAESRAAAKKLKMEKEASGMRKLSSFFAAKRN